MNDEPKVWLRRSLLVIAVLPIVLAIVRALRNDWFPIGDNALLYLRAADVFTAHHPLLGSWTSASLSVGEHMNNPGPIYSDLIAPFSKVFSPGAGAAIGVGLVNILAVLGISAAARRVGGWALERWMLLAAVALCWSMGSELLIDIWQAHAMMLPFLLTLVLLLGVSNGQSNCVPWAIGLVSLLVQTHISHAYILAVLCPVAAFGYVSARRARPHLPWRQAITSTNARKLYLLFAVLWGQSLYEQFLGSGKGNLGRLLGNAGGGSLHVGAESALGITANLFMLPTWWSRFGFSSAAPSTPVTGPLDHPTLKFTSLPNVVLAFGLLAALIVVLGSLYVFSRRRYRPVHANACLIALVAVAGSFLAVSQLTVGRVGFSSHHVRFLWPMAAFVHAVLAWVVVDMFGSRWRATRFVGWAVTSATVAFAVATAPYYAQPVGPVAFYSSMPTLRRVFPALEALRTVQPILFDVSNLRAFEPYSATVMMELRELGIEFRVTDEGMVRQLGESRRADGSERARIFQLQGPPAVLYAGPACLVVMASDLAPAAEADARGVADELAIELADSTIVVNASVVNEVDPEIAAILAAAITGDVVAARTLVYERYLSQWYDTGKVTSGRDLTDSINLVNHYLGSVYALYSEQSLPCG
ncbi:MAG: hypothetical protein HY826_11045 [Actinobacteria bacterium]|nr:hypothetical protein [Actinomycetota bacterium]